MVGGNWENGGDRGNWRKRGFMIRNGDFRWGMDIVDNEIWWRVWKWSKNDNVKGNSDKKYKERKKGGDWRDEFWRCRKWNKDVWDDGGNDKILGDWMEGRMDWRWNN